MAGMYAPEENQLFKRKLTDTRKPQLTLRQINRLRQIREMKKLEMKDRAEAWQTIYGQSEPGL